MTIQVVSFSELTRLLASSSSLLVVVVGAFGVATAATSGAFGVASAFEVAIAVFGGLAGGVTTGVELL